MPPCRLPARLRCFGATTKPKRRSSPSSRRQIGPTRSPNAVFLTISQPCEAGSNTGFVASALALSFILNSKVSFRQRLADLEYDIFRQSVILAHDMLHLRA